MAKLESHKQQKVGSNRPPPPLSFPTKITIIAIIKVNIWPTLQFESFQKRFLLFFFLEISMRAALPVKTKFRKNIIKIKTHSVCYETYI